MAENTKVPWADNSWNGWIGCTPDDIDCAACYAMRDDKYRKWTPEGFGKGKPRHRTSKSNWRRPVAWHNALRVGDQSPFVFPSLCDPFDEEVPAKWRKDAFELYYKTHHLTWLLLTKRPQNILDMVPEDWIWNEWPDWIWLGFSVGNQALLDKRAPAMKEVHETANVPIIFLSLEPLIGEVSSIPDWIDWVIAGGESGAPSKVRRMPIPAAHKAKALCQAAGIDFFFKQMGSVWAFENGLYKIDSKGEHIENIPEELLIRESPERAIIRERR